MANRAFMSFAVLLATALCVAAQRPNGYPRCDATFCAGMPLGYYQTSPCSRYYCSCTATGATQMYCGAAPMMWNNATQTCTTQSLVSGCQSPTVLISTPPTWPPVPTHLAAMCNVQNCLDRIGPYYGSYPLDFCTPWYCVCNFAPGVTPAILNATVPTKIVVCPVGQYYDFRLVRAY